MTTLRPFFGFLLVLTVAACASEPDVTFTTPPARSSASAISVAAASRASAISEPVEPETDEGSDVVPQTPPPGSAQIDVSFASQAPLGNWDDPYQEACEEASLILVHHYLSGEPLTPEIMDKEILDIVAWMTDHGYGQDVTMAQLAEVAREYYGYDARVVMEVSADAIKQEVGSGNPVILPLAGRELGNPYYSGEGPWYHALVVTGYTGSKFVTNDVGTKRGEGYAYSYDVLVDAIHDWTGVKEEIGGGPKAMLVVTK